MTDTHDCPGGCGLQVQRHQLSCKPCWFRLPKPYRDAVNDGYRQRTKNPSPHRQALHAAMTWYRDNPRTRGIGQVPADIDTNRSTNR